MVDNIFKNMRFRRRVPPPFFLLILHIEIIQIVDRIRLMAVLEYIQQILENGDITMIDYEVIEQKEILHEVFAGLLADIDYIIDDKKIINITHPLVILQKKVNIIWLEILTDKYSTMEDMTELKGVYKFIKSYIDDLYQKGTPDMK